MNDIWEKYIKYELIGFGSLGAVYRGRNKLNKEYFAIKEIKKINIQYSEEIMKKENEIIKQFKSDNVVKIIEIYDGL